MCVCVVCVVIFVVRRKTMICGKMVRVSGDINAAKSSTNARQWLLCRFQYLYMKLCNFISSSNPTLYNAKIDDFIRIWINHTFLYFNLYVCRCMCVAIVFVISLCFRYIVLSCFSLDILCLFLAFCSSLFLSPFLLIFLGSSDFFSNQKLFRALFLPTHPPYIIFASFVPFFVCNSLTYFLCLSLYHSTSPYHVICLYRDVVRLIGIFDDFAAHTHIHTQVCIL